MVEKILSLEMARSRSGDDEDDDDDDDTEYNMCAGRLKIGVHTATLKRRK